MKLNNVDISTPQKYTITHSDVRVEKQRADGLIVIDIITGLRTFNFSYNLILGTDLQIIVDLLASGKLYEFTYNELNEIKIATVYLVSGTVSFTLDAKFETDEMYTGVSFSLKEG